MDDGGAVVAYSFQPEFVEPIRVGLGERRMHKVEPKLHTIRALSKRRHARPGEELQLYCRQRHPSGFLIGRARCTGTPGIRIQLGLGVVSVDDYRAIRDGDLDPFARSDGFRNWAALVDFWAKHHPGVLNFEGVMIKWEPLS